MIEAITGGRIRPFWVLAIHFVAACWSLSGVNARAESPVVLDLVPTILSSPEPVGVAAGKRVTFTVLAEGIAGGSALSYQWYFNDEPISGAAARRSSFSFIASPPRAGLYRAEVKNAVGAVRSEAAELTIFTKPRITLQPKGGTFDAEESLTLVAAATGAPSPRFQWFSGDDEIPGATDAAFTIEALGAVDTAVYKVRVSNDAGAVFSRPASVVVRSAPEVIVSPSVEGQVPAGRIVKLQVVAVGFPKRSYQWRHYGEPIRGARAATYSFKASLENAGDYDVVVTNALGSATSEAAYVLVNTVPKFTIQPVTQAVEPGGSAFFHAFASAFPAPTYQWFRNGVPIPGATNTSLDARQTGDFQDVEYRVVATNAGGATSSAVAKMVVNLPPPGMRVGNIFTLTGKFTDNDKDSSRVDESYAITSEGWLYYSDRVSGENLGMTYEYTRTGPVTAQMVATSTLGAGRRVKLVFKFTFKTLTSGTYKMGLSSNFDFSGSQSGSFTLLR